MIGSAIGAGIAAIGSIASGISARRAAKKAEKQIGKQLAENDRWYAQEKGTNFLDTDSARSTLALLRRQNQQQTEAMNNNAVKAGASDEAKVATAAGLNQNYANAASQIAGMGTQYKENLRQDYMNRRDSLNNQLQQVQQQKAQATSDMINSFSQAGSGFISGMNIGGGKKAGNATNSADIPRFNFGTGQFMLKGNKSSIPSFNFGTGQFM